MGCNQSKSQGADAYATLQPTAEPPAPAPAQEDPIQAPPTTSVQKKQEPPVPTPSATSNSDMGNVRSKSKQSQAQEQQTNVASRSVPPPASVASQTREKASSQSIPPPVRESVQKQQPPPTPVVKEPSPPPPPPAPAAPAPAPPAPMAPAPAPPAPIPIPAPPNRPSEPAVAPNLETSVAQKRADVPQPDSSSGMRFDELYRLKGVLGTGAFSTVREGRHKRNADVTYAVKCVNRAKLTAEDAAALLDEVAILKELNHEHIIRLYDFFEEPATYYLVMERMSGGELFDRIVAKAYYNEKEARDVCKILLEAVGYCHANNVAHRDLKPENLLLLSEDDDSAVKIADFGFAKKVLTPRSLTTQCGTPGYVAPEILEGVPYDTMSDMWSVGVILYILLGGYPPFIENNQRELFRKIRRGEYEFHEEYWGAVTSDAKDLISSLLTVDPSARLTAKDALRNKWICQDDDVLAHKDLGVNLKEFKKFNAKRKFKAAVSTVMAVNKLQSLGQDFLKNLD